MTALFVFLDLTRVISFILAEFTSRVLNFLVNSFYVVVQVIGDGSSNNSILTASLGP